MSDKTSDITVMDPIDANTKPELSQQPIKTALTEPELSQQVHRISADRTGVKSDKTRNRQK